PAEPWDSPTARNVGIVRETPWRSIPGPARETRQRWLAPCRARSYPLFGSPGFFRSCGALLLQIACLPLRVFSFRTGCVAGSCCCRRPLRALLVASPFLRCRPRTTGRGRPHGLILHLAGQLSVQHVETIGVVAFERVFEPVFVIVEVG